MEENIRLLNACKRIALVVHDNKKPEIIEWVIYNKSTLIRHELFGTGTTGMLLETALDVLVKKLPSGRLEGDQQIGSKIAKGKIDVLIFFWDPMEAQPHDPHMKALLRLDVVWNIPIACDRASADFILTLPLMSQEYEVRLPDYGNYVKRLMKINLQIITHCISTLTDFSFPPYPYRHFSPLLSALGWYCQSLLPAPGLSI